MIQIGTKGHKKNKLRQVFFKSLITYYYSHKTPFIETDKSQNSQSISKFSSNSTKFLRNPNIFFSKSIPIENIINSSYQSLKFCKDNNSQCTGDSSSENFREKNYYLLYIIDECFFEFSYLDNFYF